MNSDAINNLRRRMEDVALFPPEDPQRQAVMQEISAIDGPLEQEWLQLLEDNERLRLELARVEAPAGLEQRLLAIARQHPRRRLWRFRTPRWIFAVAAVVALVVGSSIFALLNGQRSSRALQAFASLAANHHEAQPALSVSTEDWKVVEASFAGKFPLPIQRPSLDPDLRLQGGRLATLDGQQVLYTRWTDRGTTHSLYQFCAKSFGLRHPLDRMTVLPRAGASEPRCRVIIWSEDHCDYAMVVDVGVPADRLPVAI